MIVKRLKAVVPTWLKEQLRRRRDARLSVAGRKWMGSDATIQGLEALVADGQISQSGYSLLMASVMRERSPVASMVNSNLGQFNSDPLRAVAQVYCNEYFARHVQPDPLRVDWQMIRGAGFKLTRETEIYFLLSAIRSGDLEVCTQIFSGLSLAARATLPASCTMGLLRLAAKSGEEAYGLWRSRLSLEPLEALQTVEVEVALGLSEPVEHAQMAKRLVEVLPKHLAEEVRSEILPFFDGYRDRLEYMDCRTNPDASAGLLSRIELAIERKVPFSLVRLGDGESYVWPNRLRPDVIELREQVWWRTALDVERRENIGAGVRTAVENATILGVPSVYRFLRDSSTLLPGYRSHDSTEALMIVLDGLGKMSLSAEAFTEDRIHQLIFGLEVIKGLMAKAEKALIVSSVRGRILDRIFRDFPCDWETISIPTHGKTREDERFERSENSLPFYYESIDQQVVRLSKPGVLVLVAGGVIGKIFCETARREGAVALDVGAMADYWVGASTRSPADLL